MADNRGLEVRHTVARRGDTGSPIIMYSYEHDTHNAIGHEAAVVRNLVRLFDRPGYDPSAMVLIDGGAHFGYYTALFGHRFRHVVAIEPEPACLRLLRRAVEENDGLTDRVTVLDRALSDTSGAAMSLVRDNDRHLGGTRALPEPAGSVTSVSLVDVIDGLPGAGEVFVKLDIEGGEYAALASLLDRPDVAARVRCLLVEVTPQWGIFETARLLSRIHDLGFRRAFNADVYPMQEVDALPRQLNIIFLKESDAVTGHR